MTLKSTNLSGSLPTMVGFIRRRITFKQSGLTSTEGRVEY